jgi:hypothetical protein
MRIILFDIKGYTLKTEIEKIFKVIHEENEELIKKTRDKHGKNFKGRPFQAKFRLTLNRRYYERLFEEIIQLLADNNLLFDTEKSIPYKRLGRLGNEQQQ